MLAPLCGLLPFLGGPGGKVDSKDGLLGIVFVVVINLDEEYELSSFSNPPYLELIFRVVVSLPPYSLWMLGYAAMAASRDLRICSIESGIGVPKLQLSSSVCEGGGGGSKEVAEANLRTSSVEAGGRIGQKPKHGLLCLSSSSSLSSSYSSRTFM